MFRSLAHLLTGLFIFLLSFRSYLCILVNSPVSDVTYLFNHLTVSFTEVLKFDQVV